MFSEIKGKLLSQVFKSCTHGLWGLSIKTLLALYLESLGSTPFLAHLPHGCAPNEADTSHRFFSEINSRPGWPGAPGADLRVRLFFIKDDTAEAETQKYLSRSPSASFGRVEGMKFAFLFDFVQSAQHPKHSIIQPTFNEHLLCSSKSDFSTFI